MKIIIVKHSSNIIKINYENETLWVYFKNSRYRYRYPNIPEEIFNKLSHVNSIGESVGGALHRLVISQPQYKGIKEEIK